MIIPPSFIINNVSSAVNIEKQVQSAGIDLTVRNIFILDDGGELDFDNSQRFIPNYVELPKSNNSWVLQPGGYVVQYNEIVKVPLNMAAILLPRSSLMRIGATIFSALWDPGYKGRGIGLLYTSRTINLHQNARIAQLVFFEMKKKVTKGYSGIYQNEGVEEK